MQPRAMQILLLIVSMLFFCANAWSYATIDGDTIFKCQPCHPEWDNGTSWHSNHSTYASTCSACHSDFVPVDNCKTCHSSDSWQGKPLIHEPAATCLECHSEVSDGCMVESALEDRDRIDTLRQFRDEVLAPNAAGRMLIKVYYTASPVLSRAIERNYLLKRITAACIDAILPAVEKLIRQD